MYFAECLDAAGESVEHATHARMFPDGLDDGVGCLAVVDYDGKVTLQGDVQLALEHLDLLFLVVPGPVKIESDFADRNRFFVSFSESFKKYEPFSSVSASPFVFNVKPYSVCPLYSSTNISSLNPRYVRLYT